MDTLDFLAETARGAGEIIRRSYGHIKSPRTKTDRGDIVTEVDYESEGYIISRIREAYPHHNILSEEAGHVTYEDEMLSEAERGYTWLIDPLDGTRNYALGIPFFSVSIALARNGIAEYGAIYDPVHDELFLAGRGRGATMNGTPIQVSAETDLEDAVISISWLRRRSEQSKFVGYVDRISRRTSYFRRFGSAALICAYVAAGRADAYMQGGINSWDIAAGTVIIEEAGGVVTDFAGQPIDLRNAHMDILSANPVLHKEMLEKIIRGVGE